MAGKTEREPFTTKTGRSSREVYGKMESILRRVLDDVEIVFKMVCIN